MSGGSPDRPEQEAQDVLDGRTQARPRDLLDLIHAVNPTGRSLSAADERRRYRLKAGLQSLLIRTFPDDVVVAAEARGVVSIRHRHHGKDACHARLDELDVDARARVRLLLDLGEDDDEDNDENGPRIEASSRAAVEGALDSLALGRAAMAEYDYEAARAHFEEAVASTGGGPPAARALLELLVDHLALDGEALALEPQLSQPAAADAEVRALLALAAARSDDASAALRFSRGLTGARAADVWQALARAAVDRGAADEVDSCLDRLAECDPTRPDLHLLRDEARRLRQEERRPAEEELRRLRDVADDVAVEAAARALLARWPDSAVAGQVLSGVHERQRRAEADRMLEMAEAALAGHELGRAAELCRRAGAAGADAASLSERIARAEAEARRARADADVAAASALLAAGDVRPGLEAYAALGADLRRRVRSEVGATELDWLEAAAADRRSSRPRALIAAVLAVGPAIEALERGDEESALALLDPHDELLAGVARAREVRTAALRQLETRRREGAATTLEEAWLALDRGDLDGCQRLLDALKRRHLDVSARPKLDRLVDELRCRRDAAARCARIDELERAGDLVAARRELDALLARDLVAGEQAAALRSRRDRVAAELRLAWRVRSDDLVRRRGDDDGDPLGELLGRLPYSEWVASWLVADGRELAVATPLGHRVFVGRFSIEDGRALGRLALRIPERLGLVVSIVADGETIWIIGQSGRVLQIDGRTGDPLLWASLGPFLVPDETIDSAFVLPGGSHLWFRTSLAEQSTPVRVIEIDRWRLRRELTDSGSFHPLVAGGTPSVVRADLDGGVVLHDERGGIAEEVTACAGMQVSAVTRDATGSLVALAARPDGDADPVEVLRIVAGRIAHRNLLPSSDIDYALRFGASHRRGLLFIHHIIVDGRHARLAALRSSPAGLDLLYSVPAARDALFVQDPGANELVCIRETARSVELSVLGSEPPTFEGGPDEDAPWRSAPALADYFLCNPRRGGGLDLAGDPGMADRLETANAAAERGGWHQVRALLEEIPQGSAAPRLPAHHCHLLGLAHLHTDGGPDRAREAWKAGMVHDQGDSPFACRLDACLDLVEPLPDPLPDEWWGPDASLVRQLRGAIVAADAALAAGDARGALRVLRRRVVIGSGEVQAGARLASAWLSVGDHGESESFDKAIALSRFVASAERSAAARLDLPIEGAWDADRIAAVVARAEEWLAGW